MSDNQEIVPAAKTPYEAGREAGEALAKLGQQMSEWARGLNAATGKTQPERYVIEGTLTTHYEDCNDYYPLLDIEKDAKFNFPVSHILHKIGEGKRVRVTIEVLEDGQ